MSPLRNTESAQALQVLHLTPHLGGGVGKALSALVAQRSAGVRHTIVCLERPEKSQFVDLVRASGGEVVVCPGAEKLAQLVGQSDVVQLEWWNHPETISCLCRSALPPVRLLVWCHVSGLHSPIIPPGLILAAHRFVFTSACSLQAKEIAELAPRLGERIDVVSSCGGFSDLPMSRRNGALAVAYLGSLNFAKLHPRYAEYMAAVDVPRFRVRLIGDLLNRDELDRQSASLGRPGLFDFRGYVTDTARELASVNVLAYLLNPEHYGTTENALLEAMAMGIVPVVLDNPAERIIVDDHVTGLVVNTPGEFAAAIKWLAENPEERAALGWRAAQSVRQRHQPGTMSESLEVRYRALLSSEKRRIDFRSIFGADPAQWFLSCQGDPSVFGDGGRIDIVPGVFPSYGLLERTKGSVFHFHEHFPEDRSLALWAGNLERLR